MLGSRARASDRRSPAPRAYRWIVGWLRLLVRLFFREVEITGLEDVPLSRGGVLVSWHPNGLVDPGLILTHFPEQVVFGARHGLFRWPLLGTLLRSVGTVPIYRASDVRRTGGSDDARRAANQRTLDALAGAVAQGRFAALFPEGVSHDAPHLMELKTGAARLYYRARLLRGPGVEAPVIVPIGLHYDSKRLFRSRALVWFHPPIELPAALDVTPAEEDDDEAARERSRRLTDEIERVLHDVVHATEDWEIHDLIHRGRKLVRAERAHRAGSSLAKPRIGEVALGFARVRAGYYARLKSDPQRVREARARVARYDDDLRAVGLEDHELDRPPTLLSSRLFTLLVLQVLLVFVLVPPVLLFGYLINGPTALLIIGMSRVGARLQKDVATIKLLAGAVLFPLTWLAAAVGTAALHTRLAAAYPSLPADPVLAAWLAAVVAAVGGAIALRYVHVAAETARAVRVRLTRLRRAATVERLRAERAAIHDELMEISVGLDLPGSVSPDGSVTGAGGGTRAAGPATG
jgi:1-acyl-sn-glycerol-3-phosphate acyltransferase